MCKFDKRLPASRAMLMMPPLKYEAPETPEDEIRLSVASMVSFTSAYKDDGGGDAGVRGEAGEQHLGIIHGGFAR